MGKIFSVLCLLGIFLSVNIPVFAHCNKDNRPNYHRHVVKYYSSARTPFNYYSPIRYFPPIGYKHDDRYNRYDRKITIIKLF